MGKDDDVLKDLDGSSDDDDTEILGQTTADSGLANNLQPMDGATSEETGFVDVDLSGKEPTVARTPAKKPAEDVDGGNKEQVTTEKTEVVDEDDAAYSVAVRKRIDRERRLKTEERNARIVAEKEADEAKRELAKLRSETATRTIDLEIDDLKGKIKTAKHGLDHDEEVELTDKLQKANVRRAVLEQKNEEKPAAEVKKTSDDEPELHPLAKQWYSRNDWMYDVRNRDQHDEAVAVNSELLGEGTIKPQTQAFYDELDRRLVERLEERKLKVPKKNSEARTSPVVDVDTAPVRTSKKSVRLTSEDFSMMRRVGLDPENQAHLIDYARNKAKSSAAA